MLAERMDEHKVDCWLINTGWTGGRYGTGKRCPLAVTRRIVDAVHSGELRNAQFETFEAFGLQIPTAIEGVPRELLNPALAWPDRAAFEREVRKLAGMFQNAFALYENDVHEKVRLAVPQLESAAGFLYSLTFFFFWFRLLSSAPITITVGHFRVPRPHDCVRRTILLLVGYYVRVRINRSQTMQKERILGSL